MVQIYPARPPIGAERGRENLELSSFSSLTQLLPQAVSDILTHPDDVFPASPHILNLSAVFTGN